MTTVRACASRGDLPDSPVTVCVYNISTPAPLPCNRIGEAGRGGESGALGSVLPPSAPPVPATATSMDAQPWTNIRAPVYDDSWLGRDDSDASDPAHAQDDKDWPGWLPYSGIVCLHGDGWVCSLQGRGGG